MIPGNLLSYNIESFESSLPSNYSSSATLKRTTDIAHDGTHALRIDWTGGGQQSVILSVLLSKDQIRSATRFSFWIWVGSPNRTAQIEVDYQGSGGYLGYDSTNKAGKPLTQLSVNGWNLVELDTDAVKAGASDATAIYAYLYLNAGNTGTAWIDSVFYGSPPAAPVTTGTATLTLTGGAVSTQVIGWPVVTGTGTLALSGGADTTLIHSSTGTGTLTITGHGVSYIQRVYPKPAAWADTYRYTQPVRVIAQNIRSGEILNWNIPLADLSIFHALSGAHTITGKLTPEQPNLNLDAYEPWATWLHVEQNGHIEVSGILQPVGLDGDTITITAESPSGYASGLVFGGAVNEVGIDPLDVVRQIWADIQSHGDGNLGVLIDATHTPVRLGITRDQPTMRLDCPNTFQGESHPGTQVWEWPNNSTDAQLFKLSAPDPQGYVTITSKLSGLLLDVAGGSTRPGAAVTEWGADGAPSQLWKLVNHGSFHTVLNKNSGLVLDVPGNAQGARAVQNPDNEITDTQHWDVSQPDTDGYVTFANLGSGPKQPYTLNWWDHKDCASEINQLAQDTPFDYRDHAEWNPTHTNITHSVVIGYPRLGRQRDDLRFAQGQNIVNAIPLEEIADQYASEVIVCGAGQGADMIRGRAEQPGSRLRRTVVVTDDTITYTDRATARARTELRRRQALVSMKKITVMARHPNANLGSFEVGDDIPVTGVFPWIGRTVIWHRITGYTWSPDKDTVDIDLQPSASFTYAPGSSTATLSWILGDPEWSYLGQTTILG